jgi:DNA-binding transcriptional regulator YiaG
METTQEETKTPDPTVERIRALMARRNMSQMDMARYLGVPQGTIGNWLGGTRTPNASVARLVEVLGMIEVLAPSIHEHLLKK